MKWLIALKSSLLLIVGIGAVVIFYDPMLDALISITDTSNEDYTFNSNRGQYITNGGMCVCVCVCVHAHMHVHVDVNACVRVLEYICMQVLFTTWQLNLIITQQCSIFSMSLAIVK